jgi:hypothetical protein
MLKARAPLVLDLPLDYEHRDIAAMFEVLGRFGEPASDTDPADRRPR